MFPGHSAFNRRSASESYTLINTILFSGIILLIIKHKLFVVKYFYIKSKPRRITFNRRSASESYTLINTILFSAFELYFIAEILFRELLKELSSILLIISKVPTVVK